MIRRLDAVREAPIGTELVDCEPVPSGSILLWSLGDGYWTDEADDVELVRAYAHDGHEVECPDCDGVGSHEIDVASERDGSRRGCDVECACCAGDGVILVRLGADESAANDGSYGGGR